MFKEMFNLMVLLFSSSVSWCIVSSEVVCTWDEGPINIRDKRHTSNVREC